MRLVIYFCVPQSPWCVSGEYYGLIVCTKKSSLKAFYAKSPANYAKGNVSSY